MVSVAFSPTCTDLRPNRRTFTTVTHYRSSSRRKRLYALRISATKASNGTPLMNPTGNEAMEQHLHELTLQVQQLTEMVRRQQAQINIQQRELTELEQNQTRGEEEGILAKPRLSPLQVQTLGYGDRRLFGAFDARFHSIHNGATPRDFRVLPDRIVLVRHAESEGNVNKHIYSVVPDRKLPLTDFGRQQAECAGQKLLQEFEKDGDAYRLVFYISPYRRSYQTYQGISKVFPADSIIGVFEDVQLREQDFGNFQDPTGKKKEMKERLEFGRFFYRFPDGESGADVYDRITIFEDHLVRDINAGRFAQGNTNLVLVTHGLALRIILMRWFHWTVDQFLNVYNPGNCEPIILERIVPQSTGVASWVHTKMLYRVSRDSTQFLPGATAEMLTPQYTSPFS